MEITRHPTARSFLTAAESSLEEAESFNNLMLGIAYRLQGIAEEATRMRTARQRPRRW